MVTADSIRGYVPSLRLDDGWVVTTTTSIAKIVLGVSKRCQRRFGTHKNLPVQA